jgi:glutathione S-transferase
MTQAIPELFQFRYAMFPEKARWALDAKGIKHGRRSVIPGLHPPTMLKLAGQMSTPVLRLTNGELLKDSTAIVEWADQQSKQTPLYPTEHAEQVKKLVAEFGELGPHARRAYFYELLKSPAFAADLFSYGHPEKTRSRYRRGFAAVKLIMRVDMKITAKQATISAEKVQAGLDRIAELSAANGYLVGDGFTAADLTAATVLSVCCFPNEYPVPIPKPRPDNLQHWLQRWAEHPAITWVQRIYAQHRPRSVASYDKASGAD